MVSIHISLYFFFFYALFVQDTEFPGVISRPIGIFKNAADFHYQTLKVNVDLMKIIQIGYHDLFLIFCVPIVD